MPKNEPVKTVENIVHLPSARRIVPVPSISVPRAQPTPAVLFASWVAARDKAAAALLGGTQRVLLTGAAGTGKTVLIEHVARVLRAAGRTVMIQLADADPAPPGPGVTLFVDEADRLSEAKLKQLLDDAGGAVVLAGLAPLVRRVAAGTMHLTLEPLGPLEAQDYIAQWLSLNGRTTVELDSKAVRALVELSGGVPRLLSTLLAAGAWLAKSGNAPVIEAAHIKEAAELRSVLGPQTAPAIAIVERAPVRSHRLLWSALLPVVVLAGAATEVVPRLFPAQTARAYALAGPFVEQAQHWLRGEPATPPSRLAQSSPVAPATAPPSEPQQPSPPSLPPPSPPPPVVQNAPAPPPEAQIVEAPAAPTPAPPLPTPEPVQTVQIPPRSEPVPDVKPSKPAAPPSPVLSAETIEFMLRRGREMLALDDVSAARLLFSRAAESGNADAMFELGQTYDPAFLAGIGAVRQSDRDEAVRWYRQAAAGGSRAAERVLLKQ